MATLVAQMGVVLRASCAAAGLFCSTAFAQIQEGVWIPAPGGYTVAATILRPEGAGPFGAVILNHGVPVSDKERAGASSTDLLMSAAVFAQRGYVVVLPLRRGFGATGGEFAEYTGSCSHPDYLGGEQAAAEDVMAAYEYARALPYVDPHRMILAGHSAGGMVAVFTAGMRQPEGLVAVLAFAAGRGGNPALHPGVPCAAEPCARRVRAAAAVRRRRPLRVRRPDGHPLLGAGGGELPRQVQRSVPAPGHVRAVIKPEQAPSLQVLVRRAWPGSPAWPASSAPRLSAGPCAPLQRGAGSTRVRTRDTYGPPFCSTAPSMLRPRRVKEKMLAARALLARGGGRGVRCADGEASGGQCAERGLPGVCSSLTT